MGDSAKQDAGREEVDFVIWYEGETGARIGQRGMTTPLVEGVARKAWMARAALVPLKVEPAMTDRQCRDIWRLHGGDFHGPITETGTMPESTLLPLIRLLWGSRAEVSGMVPYAQVLEQIQKTCAALKQRNDATEALETALADAAHWKANHACEVERARLLKERPDMPIERTKAYEAMGEIQARAKELDALVAGIAEAFHIGSEVLSPSVIMTNIENANRRSDCLSAIEREFFTKTVPDGDGGETEECALNWGHNPEQYVAKFGKELAVMTAGLRRHKSAIRNAIDVDALAQEIRRLDGLHNLGAGALAEALMPFIEGLTQ